MITAEINNVFSNYLSDKDNFNNDDARPRKKANYTSALSIEKNIRVIKPGSIGLNAKNIEQEVMIEDIFLRPQRLVYKGKMKMKIVASYEISWTRIFFIEIEDVLEIPGETLTGIYNYDTGEVE